VKAGRAPTRAVSGVDPDSFDQFPGVRSDEHIGGSEATSQNHPITLANLNRLVEDSVAKPT
jgi:hypothetical protein